MKDLSQSLSAVIKTLGPEAQQKASIASRNACYIEAIKTVWQNPEASKLVLNHTNAFYIRKDETPRKGPDKDKPYIVCEVVLDDPLVRSEMDNKRGMVEIALRNQGLSFQEFRIIPARLGMRKRHPFAEVITG